VQHRPSYYCPCVPARFIETPTRSTAVHARTTVHPESIHGAGRLLTVLSAVEKECNGWPQFCGNTVTANSVPAVLPLFLVPSPQYYRHVRPHYCSKPTDTAVFRQSPLLCSPLFPTVKDGWKCHMNIFRMKYQRQILHIHWSQHVTSAEIPPYLLGVVNKSGRVCHIDCVCQTANFVMSVLRWTGFQALP